MMMYPTSNVLLVPKPDDEREYCFCGFPATFYYPEAMCTPCHREWSE